MCTLTKKILNNKFCALIKLNLLSRVYESDSNTLLICMNWNLGSKVAYIKQSWDFRTSSLSQKEEI